MTKCGLQLPMIINMSHFVSQQGVFCLCNFRGSGKSIKIFLGLVLGRTHKVGLVNGYPLQYERLYSRSVKPLQHINAESAHHTSVDIAVTLVNTHLLHKTEQNAHLMDIWPTLLVDRCDDVFFCFLSSLHGLNRSSLLDSELLA